MTGAMPLQPGTADIVEGIRHLRVVGYLAYSDVRARYKRSVLGPLWLTLSTALGSAGLGFIWSELMHMDPKSFVPSLTAGLILWQLMSPLIMDASTLFGRQASMIRNLNLPISIHPMLLLLRHLVNLLHNIPVFFVVSLALGNSFGPVALLAIPGLLLVCANLLWVVLLVSVLGARFRDLEYLVASAMPILMFVSPVFYRPNYLPFSENVMWFNPFSHLIELVRDPLLGSAPPLFVVEVNVAMLIVGGGLTLWLFNRKRTRIPFWI